MILTIDDLDAETPSEQEPFVIDLGDEKVTLPAARDIPSSLLIDLGSASDMELAARVLGTDEWQRVLAHPAMTLARLQALSGAYYDYLRESGLGDLGKAQASPLSSTVSGPRSRRTSGSRAKGKRS